MGRDISAGLIAKLSSRKREEPLRGMCGRSTGGRSGVDLGTVTTCEGYRLGGYRGVLGGNER